MQAVILSQSEFDKLIQKMEEIHSVLLNRNTTTPDEVISNQDFVKMMKISKRTAQTWRDEGKIAFSQVGGKIYYNRSDIQKFLSKNHNPSFKRS